MQPNKPVNLNGDKTWIPAGLLDQDANLSVVADIFLGSRAAWDTSVPTGLQHVALPEIKAFLDHLHSE